MCLNIELILDDWIAWHESGALDGNTPMLVAAIMLQAPHASPSMNTVKRSNMRAAHDGPVYCLASSLKTLVYCHGLGDGAETVQKWPLMQVNA